MGRKLGTEVMADNFKPHDQAKGSRLAQIQALGRPQIGRMVDRPRHVVEGRGNPGAPDLVTGPFYDDDPPVKGAAGAARPGEEKVPGEPLPPRSPAVVPSVAEKPGAIKGGRPKKVGEPWVEAGVSRTEWYRRRKGGVS